MGNYLLYKDFELLAEDIKNHPSPAFTADIIEEWYQQFKVPYVAFLFHLLDAIHSIDRYQATEKEIDEVLDFDLNKFRRYRGASNVKIRFANIFVESKIRFLEEDFITEKRDPKVARQSAPRKKGFKFSFQLSSTKVESFKKVIQQLSNAADFILEDDVDNLVMIFAAEQYKYPSLKKVRIRFNCPTQTAAYIMRRLNEGFKLDFSPEIFEQTSFFYSKYGNPFKKGSYETGVSKYNSIHSAAKHALKDSKKVVIDKVINLAARSIQ